VAIPYNYEQSSSSTGVISPEPIKRLFRWSDDEGEDSGYASSVTVSSVRTDRVLVHMADNDNNDLRRRLKAQEQTSRAQQEALNNIQQMLAQPWPIGMQMTLAAIIMKRSITTMNVLRVRNRRKASRSMSRSLKASKLRLHPNPGGIC